MSKLKTNLLVGAVAAASVLTLVSCGGNKGPVSVDTGNGGIANNSTVNTTTPVAVFDLKDAYGPADLTNPHNSVTLTDLTSGKAATLTNDDVKVLNGKLYVRPTAELKAGDKYKLTVYVKDYAYAADATAQPQEVKKTSIEFTVAAGAKDNNQLVFVGPDKTTAATGSLQFVGLGNALVADKISVVAHVKGKDQPVIKNALCTNGGAGVNVATCAFAGVNTAKDTKLTFRPTDKDLIINNKDGKVVHTIKETTAKVVKSQVSYKKTGGQPEVAIRFTNPVIVPDVATFFTPAADKAAVLPLTLNDAPVKITTINDFAGTAVANGDAQYYLQPDLSADANVTFGSKLKFKTDKKSALVDAYGNEVKVDFTATPTMHAA